MVNPPDTQDRHTRVLFTVGVVVCLIVLGGFGWLIYLRSRLATPPVSPPPTPTPALTIQITPNARQTTTLEVLNGSGVPGLAGQYAAKLSRLGYVVLKTGNAPTQKFTQTTISISVDYPFADYLLTDLSTFGPATTSGALKDSTASAQIIIGKNWAK